MFIIEGIIGAGKSTFLDVLQKNIPSISIAPEPVHNWEKQRYGQSFLSNFYQNPQRWGYTFELMTLMHRAHDYQILRKEQNDTFFIERSLYSGYHCFAYNSFLQGFISSVEWTLYQEWVNFLIDRNQKLPQGFIYLRIDPYIAYQRIQKRSRHAEQTISFEYLKQIYDRHEEFLITRNHQYGPVNAVPTLVLDVNNDFETDIQRAHALIKQVIDFVRP